MTDSGDTAVTAGLRDRLWQAVLDGDAYTTTDVLRQSLDAGLDKETLLLGLVAPVQEQVGLAWAANRITVAQEHAATAANERAVTALIPAASARRRQRGRVTVACVDGEWHAFPARLVAEVLQLHGWQVDYLGPQIPVAHLIDHLHRTGADAVLLSSSIPARLPTAHAVITACQAAGMPVMAGGRAFGPDGRYARACGADRWAADARGAAAALEAGLRAPGPAAARQAVDDLPHLADQEYTMVVGARSRLVEQTLTDLEKDAPAMQLYTDVQRHRTAEDFAFIVDFLATALYVDDTDLFTGFVTWTADVLEARSVSARCLPPGLDLIARQLRDFPRATALLREGAAAVAARPRPGPGETAPGPGGVA
ncbi:cobalamin-binding protein [Streptomyces minutiscleroticus]|uniref:Cobalamin-binding protein n=1 Tax=Streptomyces minutiscleroticus TaxID=68238 RepID=A0A918NP23_9ACTN|nr:cobalamin-dependent protein [Streptomyces minutiscleroticus]GGX84519.1 cobalamin-binding protein [Streptomyces minutiscleroticus]